MNDHDFCRTLLKVTMQDVREHTTVKERKAAWTYQSALGYEFQNPALGIYWYGKACCAWHARAKGWGQWMSEKKFNHYKRERKQI